MTAEARLLALLRSGGYAEQEAGFGPFTLGSDGRTYAARTARALERKGLAELHWGRHGLSDSWAWESTKAAHAAGVLVDAPTGPAPEDSYPDQTVLHGEGNVGNCLQATIAGVLGWPIEAVPHFALLGQDHWWDCAQAWLDSQGYWIDYKPTSHAVEGGELMPRCWISGKSPRGISHAVVGDSATLQMLHDPHPSRGGLVKRDHVIYFFKKPTARPDFRKHDAGRALHEGAIAALSRLMDGEALPGTAPGDALAGLADAISAYERHVAHTLSKGHQVAPGVRGDGK